MCILLYTGLCIMAVGVTGEQEQQKTVMVKTNDHLITVQLVGHVPVLCLDI